MALANQKLANARKGSLAFWLGAVAAGISATGEWARDRHFDTALGGAALGKGEFTQAAKGPNFLRSSWKNAIVPPPALIIASGA